MSLFALTIFLSAFLLFQVQLVLARLILPWFGGTPAVWTTSMMFFQVALVFGYLYAHRLSRMARRRHQAILHSILLLLSLMFLPLSADESLRPLTHETPVRDILWLLLRAVGLPFLMVSATSSLLQTWVAQMSGRSPYRLYAISNLGSLLALLTYPILVEPQLTLGTQMSAWTWAYVAFTLMCGTCAWLQARAGAAPSAEESAEAKDHVVEEKGNRKKRPRALRPPAWVVTRFDMFLWMILAACGSIVFLAVTNKMCQDVAVVPMLWVLPLSLYLLTFIIAFDGPRWYDRRAWIPLWLASLVALVVVLQRDYFGTELPLLVQILVYCSTLLTCCMVCHGEMVRIKPPPQKLTLFYLLVSIGGALGGVFVNLIAPLVFIDYWELHLALVLTVVLVVVRLAWPHTGEPRALHPTVVMVSGAVGLVVLSWALIKHIQEPQSGEIAAMRGFYGVLRVREANHGTPLHSRFMQHGRIRHGMQFVDPARQSVSTLYFDATSGVGRTIQLHPGRQTESDNAEAKGLHIGIIGMGIGTIGVLAEPGDRVRFYEINDQVVTLARDYFNYLEIIEAKAETEIVLGDGRIALEQELGNGGSQQFDVLVLDAFSGDAIPIHLLTDEAFELYWRHLRPDGVLAVHITNFHLDLSDPVRVLASNHGKQAVQVQTASDHRIGRTGSRWVLITSNDQFLAHPQLAASLRPWQRDTPRNVHWTDDYSNLFQVLD